MTMDDDLMNIDDDFKVILNNPKYNYEALKVVIGNNRDHYNLLSEETLAGFTTKQRNELKLIAS